MGNLGFSEMLVIALVALLVFGPERLPELARQAGKAMARFRSEANKSVAELKRVADVEDLERELRAMKAELRQAGSSLTGAATVRPNGSRPAAAPIGAPPPTDPDAT